MSAPVVEVAAAAISDPRGRVLLARRTVGRDLAGLWEFPGGKRERGETSEQALIRELREELGIEVRPGAPLIAVPQAYPTKRLRLDVRHVSAWKGVPKGQEGQALAWVPLHRLASYAMPPADIPVVAALTQPDRYLVTPAPDGIGSATPNNDAEWLAGLERALASGVRRLHLRLPTSTPDAGAGDSGAGDSRAGRAGLSPERRESLIRQAVALAHAAGAEAFIGGDIGLARATGAGVHLRAAQLAGLHERPLPRSRPVAASCHDEAELHHAQRLGCDFAVLGPVQPTPTHPEAPGLGWTRFAALHETVSLPIYAIGGLTPADIPVARRHGAQGIAAIRALWPHA